MKIEVSNVSFFVPTHLTVKTKADKHLKVSLEEFTADELSAMCFEFREGVFKSAKKKDPKAK